MGGRWPSPDHPSMAHAGDSEPMRLQINAKAKFGYILANRRWSGPGDTAWPVTSETSTHPLSARNCSFAVPPLDAATNYQVEDSVDEEIEVSSGDPHTMKAASHRRPVSDGGRVEPVRSGRPISSAVVPISGADPYGSTATAGPGARDTTTVLVGLAVPGRRGARPRPLHGRRARGHRGGRGRADLAVGRSSTNFWGSVARRELGRSATNDRAVFSRGREVTPDGGGDRRRWSQSWHERRRSTLSLGRSARR